MGKSKKSEKKATAREKHKQRKKKKDNDDDDPALESQLAASNLTLRTITGDGNCLFRAIADQMTGSEKNHAKLRREAVDYVKLNRDDFAPFIEDSFDAFVANLNTSGEFAGNEAIVALARVHQVKIIIHQAEQPVWSVDGASGASQRQLHIAYHDWEHYSSVRRTGDESSEPAWLMAGTKEVTDVADIEVTIDEEGPNKQPVKPKKALTARQKKKRRKEEAVARRRTNDETEQRNDENVELTLNLEQLTI